jgi:sensor histidine kinase YesM
LSKPVSISLYWRCQLIGWLIAGLYWAFGTTTPDHFNWLQAVLDFIGDFSICIFLTHSYRNFALHRSWHKLPLKALVPRIIPVIFLLGVSFVILIAIKLYVVQLYALTDYTESFYAFFRSAWLTLFVTGIRLMSIWVLAYHLYHYAQREINTAKENARLSVIAKEAQLSNLSAQLNPHFFFNSLNNIKSLVIENPQLARRAIDLLSDLLRNSLYSKDDLLITVQEELNLVKDYLELEKMRFEERLQVSITAHDTMAGVLIPPLSIQALVENAVKHGIDKRKEGGLIEVSVEEEAGFLRITVLSPGKLQTAERNTGLGLKNLEERLLLQFNGKARFDITEIPGEKISATILIPVHV